MLRVSRFTRTVARRAMRADAAPTGAAGPTLNLLFATPTQVLAQNIPVTMVTIPGETGDSGIMADAAPSISQLRPGLLTVHRTSLEDKKHFFVAGGFCVVKDDSTASVTAAEAVPVEDLDLGLAQAGLAEAKADLAKATNEMEKAEAQIGIDTFEGMLWAIESGSK